MRPTCVDAVVLEGNNLLLVKRRFDPFKGYWVLPGGHVENNETVEEAVIREVKEETGVETKIVSLIGVFSSPDRDPRHNISIAYLCIPTTTNIQTSDETSEVRWFKLSDLPDDVGFDHKDIISKAVEMLRNLFNK